MRLGVYLDAPCRASDGGGTTLTNSEALPFLTFACEVGGHFDELVLFVRDAPAGVGVDRPLPPGPVIVSLPWYSSLADLGHVARAARDTAASLWRGLERVDAVWAFGPHPYALVLAVFALLRRRRLVLGVRQDTLHYFRARLRSRRSAVLLAPLRVLDVLWRRLAHFVPVTVVGSQLEARYGGPRVGILPMTVCLVRADQVGARPRSAITDEVRVLTVGRLEPEKNPLLLVEALAELNATGRRRWHLTWLGAGRLEDAVLERARELGVEDRLELRGFVPPGPDLLDVYAGADLLVHVSLTEGLPQVLLEAMATGTPVVATAVGGVAAGLDYGRAGLLVPPADLEALVGALRAAVADDGGRDRRVQHGLGIARARALEPEAARVAAWIGRTEREAA